MSILRLLLPVILVVACAEEQSSAPTYTSEAVERHSISVSVGSSGVVEPLATVQVKSKASGEVLELLVETGDRVEEGALLVNIDPRIVRNRLAQAEAELKAAQSRRRISISQMQRAERLVKQGTYTETDYETAALELANAEAQVVTANVNVENARIAVDDTDIRAPISGTVIAKPVEKGQVISSPTQDVGGGTLLLTMADLTAVQIRALIDETDIGKIRPGMEALVAVAAYPNQPFAGEVVKIEPQAIVEQNVTMFAALISIHNPDGLLMPGMNAEVAVSIAERDNVLSVPIMALRTERDEAATAGILGMSISDLQDELAGGSSSENREPDARRRRGPGTKKPNTDYRFGGDFWVVVQEDDGDTRLVKVQAGLTDLDRVEIMSGLKENERVLILPSAHLVETQEQLQRWIKRRVGTVPGIGSK
ncbi:MAG: efflux RND transporter periplasmic adaptor subunit [Desulfobulbaceae bacterium]|nr:efflux RND transporter periplasmic adaptor subunit [Desulfobulbaceae bacterium]